MSRVRELDFSFGPLMGGFTFFPYQLALGISIRYWSCFAPAIRVYVGPFKFWCFLNLKENKYNRSS